MADDRPDAHRSRWRPIANRGQWLPNGVPASIWMMFATSNVLSRVSVRCFTTFVDAQGTPVPAP